MPKRKRSKNKKDDIDNLKRKLRKLERKIRKHENVGSDSSSHYTPERDEAVPFIITEDTGVPTTDQVEINLSELPEVVPGEQHENPQPGPSVQITEPPEVTEEVTELDTEVLDILGVDPSATDKFGPEIRNELASRLLHVAKEGLDKEGRKNLMSKYLIPSNCLQIDAPKINPEIKAALTESFLKRDKGIQVKQKQMASAISCIGDLINTQLNSKTKNNDILQKLMDASKILCDIQHADSITRRNFILFGLKNEMIEHLKDTSIDSFLFGEKLAETLRSAKAVNKSGVELKVDINKKKKFQPTGAVHKSLNRNAPPQARRPLGAAPAPPPPPAPRSREPASLRAPPRFPPPPRAHSSRSWPQQPRRRY